MRLTGSEAWSPTQFALDNTAHPRMPLAVGFRPTREGAQTRYGVVAQSALRAIRVTLASTPTYDPVHTNLPLLARTSTCALERSVVGAWPGPHREAEQIAGAVIVALTHGASFSSTRQNESGEGEDDGSHASNGIAHVERSLPSLWAIGRRADMTGDRPPSFSEISPSPATGSCALGGRFRDASELS